ncbi:hypothetical protein [Sinosporangium siamense]|uniref:Uncharacterized protein n=1 Tax=Sinosporangium siamense TaxID=1367973 RepID=A0A919RJ12_9ACTN|nr:hypothetical protein [Sinosporangium siamense]GII94717.1 hypothetical protein Ssi02_49480 [Sinosporangium siamense]
MNSFFQTIAELFGAYDDPHDGDDTHAFEPGEDMDDPDDDDDF